MSNLNIKFKKILEDLEQNIQNKEDLEYIKVQIFNLYNMFFDEINRIEEMTASRMETVAAAQAELQEKVPNAEVYEVKDGGHRPHFVGEQVEEINAMMLEFLSAIDKK